MRSAWRGARIFIGIFSARKTQLVVRWRWELGEHLASWGTNVFGSQGFRDRDLNSGDGRIIVFFCEYGFKIGQEQGENGRWDVEGGRKNNSNVSNAHFVHFRVADDPNKKRREGPDQGPVGLGELAHQNPVCRDFLWFVVTIRCIGMSVAETQIGMDK